MKNFRSLMSLVVYLKFVLLDGLLVYQCHCIVSCVLGGVRIVVVVVSSSICEK